MMTLIETGTLRDASLVDGGSTILFARLANATDSQFYSVDNCQSHLDVAAAELKKVGLDARFACIDSVVFLSCFQTPIHILYLDSYDYAEGNPLPAQIHQLAEIGAAYGKLSDDAVILLDDCNIPGGGKGLLTDRWLTERKWNLLHDKYQKLYSR
jgi:predicted O-methyltransferase YrrM